VGEYSDFHVGDRIDVVITFDRPWSLTLSCKVIRVWGELIDVGVGDTVVRFDRQSFDCTGLKIGQPVLVELEEFVSTYPREMVA
jgi:hypothetical protein